MTVKLTPERDLLDPRFNRPPPAESRAIERDVTERLDEHPWLRVLLAPFVGAIAGIAGALFTAGVFFVAALVYVAAAGEALRGLFALLALGLYGAALAAVYVLPPAFVVSLVSAPVVLLARRWTLLDALAANILGGGLAHLYFDQYPLGGVWNGDDLRLVIARDVACAAAATAVVLLAGRNPDGRPSAPRTAEPTLDAPAT